MKFREWSYWLRGGIIGGAVFVILLFLLSLVPQVGCNTNKPLPEGELYENCASTNLSELLLLPSYKFLDILDINNDFLAMSFAFVFSLVFYFVIGAIIGLIVRRIKR